jgi:hypothetical protein
MLRVKNLSGLLEGMPLFKQHSIIAKTLHEVGGMEWEDANAQAHLYVYKELFAGGEEINEIEEFKQRFARLDESDRWALFFLFPSFFCVRKCIEEFYFENSTPEKTMQMGYWRSIFDVLREHKDWGSIFLNEFELSGCRQQGGKHKYRKDSYWMSSRICEHFAHAKKIADAQDARETLQEAVARALHNEPPHWKTHEQKKAEFAQKLAEWTKDAFFIQFCPFFE